MPSVTFTSAADLRPSFTGGTHGKVRGRRCLRVGPRSVSASLRAQQPVREMGPHDVQLIPPGQKWQDGLVFRVELSDDLLERWSKQPKGYVVVSTSVAAAKSYLERRYTDIAVRQKGLAATACTRIIGRLAKSAPKDSGLGRRAVQTSAKNVSVTEGQRGDVFVMDIADNISYAELSVRGGRAGVDLAMKKAANKISANIRRKFSKFLEPGEITTPFPEVKRRR